MLALCALLPSQATTTFSTDVRVVNLFATVHDAQGHLVPNLTKDDFTLEEDGQPQTIRYFSRESGLPLTLGLLVDTSISQKRVLAEERTASYRFLSQVLRPDMDRAFVIHFDRDVELLQDLTGSREKLDAALARLQTPKLPQRKRGEPKVGLWALGGTALYDAVLLASEEVLEGRAAQTARPKGSHPAHRRRRQRQQNRPFPRYRIRPARRHTGLFHPLYRSRRL